jgi:squalene synthase HpnC
VEDVMMSEKFDWGEHHIDDDHVKLAGWGLHQNLQDAQKYCEKIAKAHYENFIITNHFTPVEVRQHIQNVYAFCRYGDDLGDDAPFPPEQRMQLLKAWLEDLRIAHKDHWSGQPQHPILIALAHTSKIYNIPIEPYEKLITAFMWDQERLQYSTWKELQEYCIHSADPVGHLFLYVYGHDDEELRNISDATCTALQLANHWQDIRRDLAQGRRYVPLETMEKYKYTTEDYNKMVYDERWISILKHEVDRAQALFDQGKTLWTKVDPHLAVDLEMFTLGGEEILKSIRKQKYNTWSKRPKVSKIRQARLLFYAKRKWKKISKK